MYKWYECTTTADMYIATSSKVGLQLAVSAAAAATAASAAVMYCLRCGRVHRYDQVQPYILNTDIKFVRLI